MQNPTIPVLAQAFDRGGEPRYYAEELDLDADAFDAHEWALLQSGGAVIKSSPYGFTAYALLKGRKIADLSRYFAAMVAGQIRGED